MGVAMGVDRAVMVLKATNASETAAPRMKLFIAAMGTQAHLLATEILATLRKEGIYCDQDYMGRGLKSQMKSADKAGARFTAIIGDEELAKGLFLVRDMDLKEQWELNKEELLNLIRTSEKA